MPLSPFIKQFLFTMILGGYLLGAPLCSYFTIIGKMLFSHVISSSARNAIKLAPSSAADKNNSIIFS